MQGIRLLLASSLVLGAASPASAQSVGRADTLTVQHALALVTGAHPSALAFELRAESRGASVDGITSWSAPTLSYAMEGIGTNGGFAEQRIVGGIEFAPRALGRAQRDRLRAERLALLSDADVVRRELRYRVVTAFVELAAADSLVSLRRRGMELADGLVRVAQMRERAGETAGIETLRAELERENAAAALAEALSRRSAAEATALASVGRPLDTRTVIAPRLAAPDSVAVRAQIGPAFGFPELRAAASRIDATSAAAEEVRAARQPTLLGEVFPQHFGRSSFGVGFQVGVRIPLFQADAHSAREQAARIEIDAAVADRQAIQTVLEVGAVSARAHVVSARAALEALRVGPLPQAEELLRLSTRGYQLGEITQAVMLDTLRLQLEIRERALNALHRLTRAVADLEYATGETLLFAN